MDEVHLPMVAVAENCHNTGGGGGANGNNGITYNGFGVPDTSTSSWIAAWDLDSAIYPVMNFIKYYFRRWQRRIFLGKSNADPTTTPPGSSGWGHEQSQ